LLADVQPTLELTMTSSLTKVYIAPSGVDKYKVCDMLSLGLNLLLVVHQTNLQTHAHPNPFMSQGALTMAMLSKLPVNMERSCCAIEAHVPSAFLKRTCNVHGDQHGRQSAKRTIELNCLATHRSHCFIFLVLQDRSPRSEA